LFRLEKRYVEDIIAHAKAEAPLECCGILAGTDDKVLKLYRTTNSEKSPLRYNVEPEELLCIYQELDEKGWQLLAVYHSHPYSKAYPSLTDIKLAQCLDVLHIIVSLRETVPVVRAFWLSGGHVREETAEIVGV
jgi:[CysO sulfur-carrier protein]-S-L-cysteine hydrolase